MGKKGGKGQEALFTSPLIREGFILGKPGVATTAAAAFPLAGSPNNKRGQGLLTLDPFLPQGAEIPIPPGFRP